MPANVNTRCNRTFPCQAFYLTGLYLTGLCQRYGTFRREHDKPVIQMNEGHRRASGWVQQRNVSSPSRSTSSAASTGHFVIAFETGDDHAEENFRCVART